MASPKTLQEAIIWFSDHEHCHRFMMDLRWPDGKVKCPRCGSERVKYLAKARVWKCYAKHERPTFSLKTGTIFEDSPIGFDKWLPAAWLIINCKNGISSYELGRGLGITQKTCWFMLHRIRLALQDQTSGKLDGEVEVDESFIGGKARNMHRKKRKEKIQGRGGAGKTIVLGMVQRGGEARAMVVKDRSAEELQPNVKEQIAAGSAIFTDDLKSYEGLEADYAHDVVNHAVEYVRGIAHTNSCENFWSLLKRMLHGTYISVEPFHLHRYLAEECFRYNYRKLTDSARFVLGMKQVVDRRLTYQELIGKSPDSVMCLS